MVRSSYSRRVEAAADVYSVGLMHKAGGDPRALAAILARVTADKDEGIKILADHPDTKDRVIAINAIAPAGATTPLLGAADWAALKQICAPSPAGSDNGSGRRDDGGSQRDAIGKRRGFGIRQKPEQRANRGQQMKAQSHGATPNH